jgi:RNA polymerase sigma factor (sigma-70 family)
MATNPVSKVIQHLRSAARLGEGVDRTDAQLLDCFVSRREQAALETLVRRHGPMVWGVCRRILRNHHDAEDAFQATFLVLVRKVASIVPKEMVGNWLYGVAQQTALKARATAAKRQTRERHQTDMPDPAVMESDLWPDLQPLLDKELRLLPDKYRVVIVLCDLEGKTRPEAARHLGCPEGTVGSRLARARTMLAKRLVRHGLALSSGTLAAVLSEKVAAGCVPASVLSSTIKIASLVAAGQAATGMISGKVAALTEGVLKAMFLTKLKTLTTVLLVLALIALGGGLFMHQAGAQQSPGEKPPTEGEKDSEARQPTVKAAEKLKDDKAKLQGTWLMVSGASDGDAFSDKIVKDRTIVIDGDKITEMERGKKLSPSHFVLNATTNPKAIDATPIEGDFKGMMHLGIYALQGDSLKVCFGKSGDKRPNDFTCEKGSRRILLVYKREAPKKDADEPAGTQQSRKDATSKPIKRPCNIAGNALSRTKMGRNSSAVRPIGLRCKESVRPARSSDRHMEVDSIFIG